MVPPVVAAVSAMKVGTYSTEPVKSDFGYHVLLLEDARTQDAAELRRVRDEIKNAVERDKIQKHMRRADRRRRAVVEGDGTQRVLRRRT